MRSQLEDRLRELRAEFDAGRKLLAGHEADVARLNESLLRISGAIQVLEEELERDDTPEQGTDEGSP